MAKLFLENVHRFLLELTLHEVEAVTKHYHRDILMHVSAERLHSLLGESVFPVTSGLHVEL